MSYTLSLDQMSAFAADMPTWAWVGAGIVGLVVLHKLRKLFTPSMDVRGKVVLITGASMGIGRLMAIEFAKRGAVVVGWDLRKDGLEELATLLTTEGHTMHCYAVDVSDRHAVYAAAKKTESDVGPVFVLVNNAGIVSGKPVLELQDEQIVRTFEVNAIAHFWTLKAFLPGMMQRKQGHVTTLASVMGMTPAVGLADYCASKGAALLAAECVSLEVAEHNIGTTIVCPGGINTGMFDGLKTKMQWLVPMLEPDHVAQEVVRATVQRQKMLILPGILNALPLFRLMPVSWAVAAGKLLGAGDAMRNFKGRNNKDIMAKKSR